MKYNKIVRGTFVERPNRFIAKVMMDNEICTVHVKNTGRCRELLVEGTTVYLSVSDNPARKTKYDLIAVEKVCGDQTRLINMDSQIVNDVAEEYLRAQFPNAYIKREVTYVSSRFDFYIENGEEKAFLEVKGVTLENDGIVSFPDAPTERGIKHLKELMSAKSRGYMTYVLFIIQMRDVKYFTPNDKTHKEFGNTLRQAKNEGVNILAIDCLVEPDSINYGKEVEIIL